MSACRPRKSASPGTVIAGDLVYTSPKTAGLRLHRVHRPEPSGRPPRSCPPGLFAAATQARFLFHGYLFLAALLVGMPFVGFFPLLAGGAVRNLRTSPWRVLLAGP
jgi:hypothetical protein